MPWWVFAFASAGAAAVTAILAKIGVEGVPSNLATAVRTAVVLVFAWGIVILRGEHHALAAVRGRPLLFLALSGMATGLSWLFYYKALKLGEASRVAPIDKLSVALAVGMAFVFLGEKPTTGNVLGAVLVVAGVLVTALVR